MAKNKLQYNNKVKCALESRRCSNVSCSYFNYDFNCFIYLL